MTATISGYGIELQPLTAGYLEQVRQWRNHPEVARYMVNQEPISAEQQRNWFQNISSADHCAHYLIFFRATPIGLIYLHAKDQMKLSSSLAIETGMYLAYDSPYRGTLLAFSPALAINDYCFEQLGCPKLFAEVQQDNRAALRFNEKLGYLPVAQQDGYVSLELDHKHHKQARQQLQRFLHFEEE